MRKNTLYQKINLKVCVLSKGNLQFILENIHVKFNEPEWGFPKGKRTYLEKYRLKVLENLKKKLIIILMIILYVIKLVQLMKYLMGQRTLYKHIYYIAIQKNNAKINKKNQPQIDEIVILVGLHTKKLKLIR